jgi:hypothetical protein
MSVVTVTCVACLNPHTIRRGEWNRSLRKNPDYKFYCSNACHAKHARKYNLGKHLGFGDAKHLNPGNRQDEFSPFRYFMLKARNRRKFDQTDLDLPFLKALWDQQRGRCAISGIEMLLPSGVGKWMEDTGNPWKPSLDRIDSTRGYIKGNVQYVTVIANFCKQRFLDEDVIRFGRAVAQHNA